jgi:putative tryptophan/tyrosine transport system substrate-binding protein
VNMSRGLAEIGFSQGRDMTVKYHIADVHLERLSALAADLARRRPAAIIVPQEIPASAAKAATRDIHLLVSSLQAATDTIPILGLVADPVEFGNVTSVARPDRNFTAIVNVGLEIWGKRLQILREAVPAAARVGYLGSRVLWDTLWATPYSIECGRAGDWLS